MIEVRFPTDWCFLRGRLESQLPDSSPKLDTLWRREGGKEGREKREREGRVK